MKIIYKYPIGNNGIITMPRNSEILTVGQDPRGKVCLWAIVDIEDKENKEIRIAIIGTGWPILEEENRKYKYINTFKQELYVWHAFEIEKE